MFGIVLVLALLVQVDDRVTAVIREFGGKELSPFEDSEIAKAIVKTYQHPFAGPDIGPFECSQDDAIKLTRFIRNSKVDTTPNLAMAEIATFRLVSLDGRSQRVCIFWYNAKQSTLCFSLNGVRCITTTKLLSEDKSRPLDHALTVDGFIRRIAPATSSNSPMNKPRSDD